MDLEIRRLLHRDLAVLVGMGKTVVTPTRFQTMLENSTQHWVAAHGKTAVGYTFIYPVPGLEGLFELKGEIAESSRRQGVGSFLWQHVKGELRETAVKQLSVSTPATKSPAAFFVQKQRFHLEHTEWQMSCSLRNYPANSLILQSHNLSITQLSNQQTITQLPTHYDRCFAQTAWYQPYTVAEMSALVQADDELWLLKEEDETIGFAWLHGLDSSAVQIEPIGIFPERQGMGYGRSFLNALLINLKNRGKQQVELGVWASNHPAVSLYQKAGFQTISETYYWNYSL